jgi:hypothetical protein
MEEVWVDPNVAGILYTVAKPIPKWYIISPAFQVEHLKNGSSG